MVSGSFYAVIAGFLGAAASLSAKLSLGADFLRDLCVSGLGSWSHGEAALCDWVPLRLLCGGLLFACNALMWTVFSKALRHCSSSARATVTTTASNFLSSGIMGGLIFGENHSALWWTGITVALCGLMMLHTAAPQTRQDTVDKDE